MAAAAAFTFFFFFLFLTMLSTTTAATAAAASVNTIALDKVCYNHNEIITISYSSSRARSSDVIGITSSNATRTDAAFLLSTSLCGSSSSSSSCSKPRRVGNITLEQNLTGGLHYMAVLRRANGQIVAKSSSFLVATTTTTCPESIIVSTSSPTASIITSTASPSHLPTTFSPSHRPTNIPSPRPTKAPSRRPTRAPRQTRAPVAPPTESPTTMAPTKYPTKLPTRRPTFRPTTAAPTPVPVSVVTQTLAQARTVITAMVRANPRLTPEFLRMGFHDCVGGCDGCIDLSDPNNFGLAHPISVLQPVVDQFDTPESGVSRADIWALASMVGADVAPHGILTRPVHFNMNWFGRVNCEDANTVCRNNKKQVVACNATAGPGRIMASINMDSQGVMDYFSNNFGFNARQTVTILGAHTIGMVKRQDSGFDGPNGWVLNNNTLQNEFYDALMGDANAATPPDQITSICPDWERFFTNNGGTSFPHRNTWNLKLKGKSLIMLNTDISLVRNLNSGNLNTTTGAVSCAFSTSTARGSPLCPLSSTIGIVEEFAASNDKWLNEFSVVLDLMLTNGYSRQTCSNGVCRLTPN